MSLGHFCVISENVLCSKKLINETHHFWEIGLITRRFGRIHSRVDYKYNILTILFPMSKSELILKLKFYYNGVTAKHVGQLQLCVNHMQLAILLVPNCIPCYNSDL
jgi:hypothetical protein